MRDGMSNIVSKLRGMTNSGTADYSVSGTNYWSDDHILDVLDRQREDIYREPLNYDLDYVGGGSVEYKHYKSKYTNLEGQESGTAIFRLEQATGDDISGTAYTADYNVGTFDFTADQGGTIYYMTGRTYNLNAAAADVWRAKAGHYAQQFNFRTDNHTINRGDVMKQCLEMAAYYDGQAGAHMIEVFRGDEC